MNKNLKKVISAVISLAISASTVAMAATGFTDVAETASYAQAVNTLAALGVIAGYDEGGTFTFKPENNITRAEVTTMVVAALNRSADAAGSKGTTKFDDVNTEATAWASGYVNIGTTEGFIAGFEDGSFKPAENVTYTQIVKMLVCIAGYERYAEYLGGWPNGYLSVGSDKGITKGVSAGSDAPVTRAQVAQLIYNTLVDVPIVESTTLVIDSNGKLVPEMSIMDGKNDNDYKTLLTQKHNAYYVEGFVSATNRSKASLDADEVEFDINYTENYNDNEFYVRKSATDAQKKAHTETVYVGDTKAADYLLTYASAIIKIDDDGEGTIVSFVPSGKNKVETFDASLFDDSDLTGLFSNGKRDGVLKTTDKPFVKYYATKDASKSTKYTLADNYTLYVNGVEVTVNAANILDYVVDNTVGKVELIDLYSATQKADGYYDAIFVTYYATAKVGAVNLSSGKVSFDKAYNNNKVNYITLDPEDDDIVYDIIYNGEKLALSGLKVGDIISIAYDVEKTLTNSDFFEIHVSRDTAEGKYTGKNAEDKLVTIGGKSYEFVNDFDTETAADVLEMSSEYTMLLDAFGRIFETELATSSAKLAIVDKYALSSADDYHRALLYTTDGTTKNLEVDTTKFSLTIPDGVDANGDPKTKTISGSDIDTYMKKVVYVNGNTTEGKTAVQNRVVEYKVSSTNGRIISLKVAGIQKSATEEDYKESSRKVGSLNLGDATKVIDAGDYTTKTSPTYSDLSLASISSFIDGNAYTAYAYGTRNTSDSSYPLVIVTKAGSVYNEETRFAVLTKDAQEGDDNGDTIVSLEALYNGEEVTLKVNDDADVKNEKNVALTDASSLKKGDVIVFVKDAKDNIKTLNVIATAKELGLEDGYNKVVANAFAAVTANRTMPTGAKNWTGSWTVNDDKTLSADERAALDYSKDVTRLVYGPIVEKKNNLFRVGKIASATEKTVTDSKGNAMETKYTGMYTNLGADNGEGAAVEFAITNDTKVYVYDYAKTKLQIGTGLAGDIIANSFAESSLLNAKEMIPWNADTKEGVNFAFVRVVDGDAMDVFVISAK